MQVCIIIHLTGKRLKQVNIFLVGNVPRQSKLVFNLSEVVLLDVYAGGDILVGLLLLSYRVSASAAAGESGATSLHSAVLPQEFVEFAEV